MRSQHLESLEDRRLLSSITYGYGAITVTGNSSTANTISVMRSGTTNVIAKVGTTSKTVPLSYISKINITGGSAADKITIDSGLAKSSYIKGLGGSDYIVGGASNDAIYAGDGNDTVYGNGGNDPIYGENGDDRLDGGSGTDTITGGAGNNYITTAEVKPTTTTTTTATSTSSPTVTSLVLYNADTDRAIATLTSGQTFNIANIGTSHLTVVATLSNAKSMKFGLDSNNSYRVESGAPFALAGDSSGNYAAWNASTGVHTVSATPYSATGATGTAGTKKSVSFTIINSNTSGSGTTPTSTSTGTPYAVIAMKDSSITEGHAVHVNGLNSTLNGGTPLTAKYDWDFGDAGSRYNTLTGWNAAHVYDAPGNYTVKLTITNEGRKIDTATMTVNVSSASRRLIYVSAAGSDSNDGSSSRPIRTFGKAVQMATDNVEILFRAGDTFTTSTGMTVTGRHNMVIGTYGSGKAIIKYNGGLIMGAALFTTGSGSDQITIENLTLDSIYTNSGTYEGMPVGVGIGGTNTTVRGCQFLNLADAVNTNRAPVGVMVSDNTAPIGLRGYFAWVQGSDHVYVGNSVADSLYQHVLRDAGSDRILIAKNNFTNKNTGVDKGCLTIHKGNYVYITGNTLSTGKLSIGPLGQGDGLSDPGARLRYVVAEGNTMTGLTLLETGAEHLMLRNNIFKRDGDAAIEVEAYSSTYGRGVVDCTIVNNTAINNSTAGNFVRVDGNVAGISLVNNLYLAKNLVTGGSGSAPVLVYDTDLSSFRTITNNVWCVPSISDYAQGGINYVWSYWSNASGYKTPAEWESLAQVGKDYYEDPSYGSNYAPSTSSKTATAGIAFAGVFADFYGNARAASGSWTAGAVEV
jgi:PKD repeat protein